MDSCQRIMTHVGHKIGGQRAPMIEQILVSYIVAIYNAEVTLPHCLDSLINQTHKELEIILINDGSTDSSASICEEYARKDPRIRVLHQSNKGVSYTRQRGLDEARGKYVIHADPDDWVESDTLSQMVAYAEEHQTDILISDFWFNGPGQCDLMIQKPSGSTTSSLIRDFFSHIHGSCWNKLVRLDTIRKHHIQFNPQLTYCEDLLFHLQLISKGVSYGYINIAHYHYFNDSTQPTLTRRYDAKMLCNDTLLYEEVKKIVPPSEHPHTLPDFAALLVSRAFLSKNLSNSTFRKHFSSYAPYVRKSKRYPASNRFLLYLSCIGYYRIAKSAATGLLAPVYNFLITLIRHFR